MNNNIQNKDSRDHRVLGQEQGYFSHSDKLGQGLILWNPNGAMVRHLLERFSQEAHILNGYSWVYSPHIGRAELWETSGHLNFFKDSMYSPIDIDGENYYLKPMNCPFHILIYNEGLKSYRDLPVRYAEYGTVYRYELSGALSGMARVRGFTQDDAHIICTPDQVKEEIGRALKFSLYILKSFGIEKFKAYVATKPEKKCVGDDEEWELAHKVLEEIVQSEGLEYEIDEGGGAFYGPKIDLKIFDSQGKEWQCSTIQFDFNLPRRFEMKYIGVDGQKHIPMMVHRALFGSLERFFAVLVEHYGGDFPFWLSPVQVGIVPVHEKHLEYCKNLSENLRHLGIRFNMADSDDKLGAKIRNFELQKVPAVFVVGDKEVNNGGFSVRLRKHGDKGFMTLEGFMELMQPEIEKGKAKYLG